MTQHIDQSVSSLGKVEITPEVLSVIASIATSEVKGLHGLFADFKATTLEKFGKKNLSKGIKLETKDDGIYIDVYCSFKYGVKISETAHEIQEAINHALITMTSIEPRQINVHITHIEIENK